jgi:DNA polymerase-3 subunit gamma/tau
MSDSQVIARRFRPRTFDEVIGQEAITRTLANAIESKRIHHAYVFAGARGVGKTTTARILAKALNCKAGLTTRPCGACPSCIEISASSSIDVLEIDAASNTGVDNVRDSIINTVSIAPARDRYKIFIIDEVHQLSSAAFNALLKTLEEPPAHVLFVMATTEMHKVPETILSRCQVFEFRTISTQRILDQLRNIAGQLGLKVSEAALMQIARAGEGSMRDAQSSLDQVVSFAGNEITAEDVSAALGLVDFETLNALTRAIAEEDSNAVLRVVREVISRGYDLRNLCRELMAHFRSLLVIKITGFDPELVDAPPGESDVLVELAGRFSEQDLLRFFSILTKTEQDIRLSSQARFQLEVGLIKLVHAGRLYLIEEAMARLQRIEHRLGSAPLTQTPTTRAAAPEPRPNPSATPNKIEPVDIQSLKEEIAAASRQKALGRSVRPPAPVAPPPPEPAEPGADVEQHPGVRALVDTFHGKVVEVKKRESGG